jgi:hypothetical protein
MTGTIGKLHVIQDTYERSELSAARIPMRKDVCESAGVGM